MLGTTGTKPMVFAFAGDDCAVDARKPALSVNIPVETRCDGGKFHAQGLDDHAPGVVIEFEFLKPSDSFCRRGEGVLRITKGDRQVVAERATFSTID
jgi:hypothetical protein